MLGVALPPARAANADAAAPGRSAIAAGDVLFWARADGPFDTFSIVKAAAARPALIATVLSASAPTNYNTFSDPEASPDGTKLAYIRRSGETWSLEVRILSTGTTTVLASETNMGGSTTSCWSRLGRRTARPSRTATWGSSSTCTPRSGSWPPPAGPLGSLTPPPPSPRGARTAG